jgi:hypothetical protein
VGAAAQPADAGPLERAALEWVAPYWNARHLVRTRDWLLTLDPDAGEALRLAALTHDIERHFPGGPRPDPAAGWDDPAYLGAHCARSAAIVAEWLRGQGAPEALVAEVADLVRRHEDGGSPAADLLQAADSLSYLEVNGDRPLAWVREGRCDVPQAEEKLALMYERIRVDRARELAAPFLERAQARLRAGATA